MTDEKPLHVQVAEALGWINLRVVGALPMNPPVFVAKGRPPGNVFVGPLGDVEVQHYDTDWSATGPLIEKYGINLGPTAPQPWFASDYGGDVIVEAATPLIAVCNLILALAKAGKLNVE